MTTPVQRGDLILSSQRIFWRIVKKSEDSAFRDLENKGMADNRSGWMFTLNDKGEIIIFNECITSGVFDVFDSEFFAESDKEFDKKWRKVERLPIESDWADYVPSSGSNGRNAFKQFGWKMNDSIFTPRAGGEETDDYADTEPPIVVFRKKMD